MWQLFVTAVLGLREIETSQALVAQTVKHLSTMRETRVQSLGWEDPLEKKMVFQYSCLENPMDRGSW